MNTKYRYKPTAIDAIQFHCTPEGIAAIAVFGGTDFTGINNQRVNGTPAAAYVNGLVIPEGSWLLRNATGMYKVLKDSVFTAVCEEVLPVAEAVDVKKGVDILGIAKATISETLATKAEQEQANYAAAVAAGTVRYAMTKPCLRGHITERYTNGKGCATCMKSAKARHKASKARKVERESKTNFRKALKACAGPFAPLAASIAY